ncbi:hypothetical protein PHJA_000105300 [Phtheirospermum japonicum]|uniref:S-protein homolog n=1 Tax=Phtheirospermum japonicum TaxID=374723 RepID=A0A830B3Q8_9LAMI|nr:hypothetical protein PHJA_000105300 [Phtheirospermum japonicum]
MTIEAFFEGCWFGGEYSVSIENRIFVYPETNIPLKIHCASKETELWFYNVSQSKNAYWDVCMNIWRTTMFFCHFWWGDKQAVFEVFNYKISETCQTNHCLWIVGADGIALVGSRDYHKIDFYYWQSKEDR